MILETIEPYLEVLNLITALFITFIGISIIFKLDGELKKAWKYFLTAIVLFGIHEIFGSLAEFGVFEIEGLYAFTEFLYILAFVFSIFAFKKLFENLSKGKKEK